MQVRWTTAAASPPDGLSTQLLNVSIVADSLKRDFIPHRTRDGEEVSLRRPTHSQERMRKKKRRPAPFEMTVWSGEAKEGRGRAKARPYKEQALHASGAAGAYER